LTCIWVLIASLLLVGPVGASTMAAHTPGHASSDLAWGGAPSHDATEGGDPDGVGVDDPDDTNSVTGTPTGVRTRTIRVFAIVLVRLIDTVL
jgi:hypothetical protein